MSDQRVTRTTQALILAGGRGERLRPITDSVPKAMVPINNRPFLEYQIQKLREFGITNIVMSLGFLSGVIRDHFGDGSKFGVNIEYSVEERFLGTGGALKIAERYLDSSFFIMNGDTYLPINYAQLEAFFWTNHEDIQDLMGVISVYSNNDKIVKNNIIIDPQNYILKYNKVEETDSMNGVEAGVSIFEKKVLEFLPAKSGAEEQISFEIEVFPQLVKNHQLLGFLTGIRFYDIGTPERLKVISEVLK